MTNTKKIKGRMAEQGYTLSKLAEEIKISRPALRNKINGQSDFRASEIERMCSILSISQRDMCSYFFAEFVPNMETA